MDEWIRIGDDEIARFGYSKLLFVYHEGSYELSISQSEQDYLTFVTDCKTGRWPINLKECKGKLFKLSGAAWPEPEKLFPQGAWFELVISSQPTITYWGDRVVLRVDSAVSFE